MEEIKQEQEPTKSESNYQRQQRGNALLTMLGSLLGPKRLMEHLLDQIVDDTATQVTRALDFAFPTCSIIAHTNNVFRPTDELRDIPDNHEDGQEGPHENTMEVRVIICASHGNMSAEHRAAMQEAARTYSDTAHAIVQQHLDEVFPESKFISKKS